MASRDSGCYMVIFVVVIIGAAIWSAGQWLVGKMTGNRAEHAQLMEDARAGIVAGELGARTVRAQGTLKRMRLDGEKWVYAGENDTMGTYLVGVSGEGRVDCAKDVQPMPEGEGFFQREFSAVYAGGVGKTLTTRAGGVTDGPAKTDGVEVVVEKKRPVLMEGCDEGCGWAYSVYGRWPGNAGDGQEFFELLDGRHPGVTTVSDYVRGLPTVRVRVEHGGGLTDVYWLDINSGYGIIRWEHRMGTGTGERETAAWEVKSFLMTPRGFYFPGVVEGERMDTGGKVVAKWQVDVTHIWVNADGDAEGMHVLKIPAGKVAVHEEGKPERTLQGTAEENSLAVNGGWGTTTQGAVKPEKGNLK